MECELFAPTLYLVAQACDSLLQSLPLIHLVKNEFQSHDFYYLILIIYIIFSNSSPYMLQNKTFKNNFDLLWCYMCYIITGKR